MIIWKLKDIPSGVKLEELPKSQQVGQEVAAAYCQIDEQTLHNKNSKKRGPHSERRFGKRVYVIADLDKWLDNETEVKRAYA